jgi:hypothetical protein
MEPSLMDKQVDVMVLERLTASNLGVKAPSVGPLGAEALQRRGMGAALAAEDRTFAEMANGDGILLDASPDGRAADPAAGFTSVRCVPAEPGPSMLIRPDGCIAWAGEAGEVEW